MYYSLWKKYDVPFSFVFIDGLAFITFSFVTSLKLDIWWVVVTKVEVVVSHFVRCSKFSSVFTVFEPWCLLELLNEREKCVVLFVVFTLWYGDLVDVVNSTGTDILVFKFCCFPVPMVKEGVSRFCCWCEAVINFVVTEKEIPSNHIYIQRTMKARRYILKKIQN